VTEFAIVCSSKQLLTQACSSLGQTAITYVRSMNGDELVRREWNRQHRTCICCGYGCRKLSILGSLLSAMRPFHAYAQVKVSCIVLTSWRR
jgi:hypothetical protein